MSQKDSLFRLKNFFRMDKSSSGNHRDRTDADLLRELDIALSPHVAIAQRCKTLKDLCDTDKLTRLEDATILKLWELTKDLLVSSRPIEQRHITYRFYQKLVQCQYEELSVIREHFFRKCFSEVADIPDDIQCQIDLLKILTDNGKNIKSVDDVIGDFILHRWLATVDSTQQIKEILEIIQNIIVYNAAYLNPNIVDGIIVYACNKCYPPDDVVPQCLDVLDAVLCYTILPQKMLLSWIGALCRTVNQENHVQKSWDIMKKLLGTKMGHAALLIMCNILDNSNYIEDDTLLRGAVFYINMGLWGSTSSKVMLFKLSPTSVLQSYLTALRNQRVIVTYEVIIGIQRLIEVSGRELTEPTWDVLCEVLKTIADNIAFYERADDLPREHVIQQAYHETLDKIENLIQRNEAATDLRTIYSVIEYVCENRSEESVIRLMEFKASKISPTQSQWLHELNAFMNRFYRMKNFTIRNTALQILNQIMEMNKSAYEEEILESIVIPTFLNVSQETEPRIRTNVVKLLLNFVANCETKRSIELLDIIEKVTNRPFDRYSEDNWIVLRSEDELLHIVTVVDELIRIFLIKLYALPSSHAIKIFTILEAHIEKYYQKSVLLDTSVPIRNRIFTWMLKLRTNATYHIGYPDDVRGGRLRFSHFLAIDISEMTFHQPLRQSQSQSNGLQATQISLLDNSSDTQPTVSVKRCCKIIIDCLIGENNWTVMQLVMKGLPLMLQNKAFFRGVDMEMLASTIIGLATKVQQQMPGTKSRLDSFVPSKPQSSDFQGLIINILAALIPYHLNMSAQSQGRIINSLRPGLLSLDTTPRVCVQAFTIMLMETMDSILRHLPEILLDMSRMMTTLNVAVPVLEFLSTLSRLPSRLFASFTQTQYMYVFAISLPYTNPHKYDHYTVSLAHHVIAGWFLKCRLSLRKDFVKYILKGFTTNVQKPFEEIKKVDVVNVINEDSSNRKRSSSVGANKQRERPSFHQIQYKSNEQADAVAYDFHMELADTCIDFLSRHTYSTCAALPKRSPTTEYLLGGNNGSQQSWLVGNNVITVTTSCCSLTAVRGGLCDRCTLVCRPNQKSDSSSNGVTSPEVSSSSKSSQSDCQRYTKASLQHNNGQDSESSELLSTNSSTNVATPLETNGDQNRFPKQPSNDGRFSTSSGSLDALSRRGSNPDTFNHTSESASKHSSMSQPMYLSPQPSIDRFKQVCICSCSGWAEILIQRPTGNMSWIMRIQNHMALESFSCDVPLQDLINICTPSMADIYNIQDLLHEDPSWNSNSANAVSPRMSEHLQKRITSIDVSEHKMTGKSDRYDDPISGSIIQRSAENVTTIAVKETLPSHARNSNTPMQLSGPIAIPKTANKDKIPSGSFSDIEPDDDDDGDGYIDFDDNDSPPKLIQKVRRVNSSPEMSSNWRHPFINPKANPQTMGNNNGLSVHGPPDDDFNILDSEQQQKKKNYGKVSCEAIPEEIADSTPPKLIQNDKKITTIKADNSLIHAIVASGDAKNQQNDFIAKSTQAQSTLQVSMPAAIGTDSLVLPRKQHSADDADQLQSKQQQQPPINEPRHSSSGSAINLGGTTSNSKRLSIEMQPNLTKKPPQPQPPLSPRLLRNYEMSFLNNSNNFNDFSRGRSKTISVVRSEHTNRDNSKWTFQGTRSAISPSSIFLQLFHTGPNRVTEQPLLISAKNARSLKLINLTPPYEIHKIAVLYVGRGQAHNEIDILSNCYGSSRYMEFIQNLGSLVALKNARELNLFIDMETDGRVGNFTYVWQDDIIQVMFHVATLMPNNERDPNRTEKKKHIGNDNVTIVYNESGEEYNLNTIKGQFNYACVVVEPLELNSNRIFVRGKDDVAKYICNTEPKIISDSSAPGYARQLALHANLASLVAKSLQTKNARPYASNWLERLRQIKNLRAKILKEAETTTDSSQTLNSSAGYEKETEDFTKYT